MCKQNDMKISVIVPIYNVEEYLVECLDSLAVQTLEDIEIIMVDDGSKDSSGDIAKTYSEKYKNFFYYPKENGGLGQARNYGVKFATGKYLTFVDSDDIVEKNAYMKMYKMAEEDKCDIVIGNVQRFNSQKIYDSTLHTKVFKETIRKTHITKNTELLYDTTAWNKLFRVDFWEKHNLTFPEGILYEDIPVTIPAHYLSSSTSVLQDIVYYWRERDGITKSITQERTDITNFLDRLYGLKIVDNFLDEIDAEKSAKFNKYFKWLDLDIKLYINKLDEVDDDYRRVFIETVREYIKDIPAEIYEELRAIDKMKYYCINRNDMKTLLKVIGYEKNNYKYLKVKREKDKFFGDFPFINIPKKYMEMTKEFKTCKPKRQLKNIVIKNNILTIEGFEYIPRVNYKHEKKINLKAFLINTNTEESIEVAVEKIKVKGLTQKDGVRLNDFSINNRIYNYDWCGYKVKINLLDRNIANIKYGDYKIVLKQNIDGFTREFQLGGPVAGKSPRPVPWVGVINKYIIDYNKVWDLRISVTEQLAAATAISDDNERLYINGWISDTQNNNIQLINWKSGIKKDIEYEIVNSEIDQEIKEKCPNAKGFRLAMEKEKLFNEFAEGEWFLNYYKNGKRDVLIGNNIDNKKIVDKEGNSTIFNISKSGAIIFRNNIEECYLKNIVFNENSIFIEILQKQKYAMSLEELSVLEFKSAKYGKYIRVPATKTVSNKKVLLYEITMDNIEKFLADTWEVYLKTKINNKIVKIPVSNITKGRLKKQEYKNHKYLFTQNEKGNLQLDVTLKWGWIDKGPRRREAIERYIYPLFRLLPLKKKNIVFESFWGDKYNCNPKYIYEYINKHHKEYKCIWNLTDENIAISGNGIPVRIGTLKYFYYMATSKYFVNNVNFPDFHKKRMAAREIQTMHGTPLKTLGLDVPGEFKTREGKEKFIKRCAKWDYLVVPSDFVSNITKSCFRYEKNFITSGYPRNDKLFYLNNESDIESIKKELNIPDDKKVILYAPTWRIKDKFELMINVEKMSKKLGEEYVLLLKLHPFSIKGLNKAILNDFVMDVSGYTDIEKLYVISDLVVTDYSSVMFDYALLNKPMIFYTYDLNLYKNNLRGFNIDFESEAPGPLILTSDDLIYSIENINDVQAKYIDKYTAFKSKYCQYDKGNASEQIYEKVFINS